VASAWKMLSTRFHGNYRGDTIRATWDKYKRQENGLERGSVMEGALDMAGYLSLRKIKANARFYKKSVIVGFTETSLTHPSVGVRFPAIRQFLPKTSTIHLRLSISVHQQHHE